uniref:RNA polymerase II-associated protein 3 n=1 Tax=Anthurium amnicola TaxID=1678845 RepID=A0A1D1XTE6_9ARAE
MAAANSRAQDRNRTRDFEGFLNNLQDWDSKGGDRRSKVKAQVISPKMGEEVGARRKDAMTEIKKQTPLITEVPSKIGHEAYRNVKSSDAIKRISTSLFDEETPPTAASEKELGNEYFKQNNFLQAIECYSRSIALSPTSVAFANRAMAYLKVKRYEEAEIDCTEALNLDDRYVKAYSRRATARKELGKLKLSLEDSEFALRLEPNNQELKKLYSETKALYEGEVVKKVSGAAKSPSHGIQGTAVSELGVGIVSGVNPVSISSQTIALTAIHSGNKNFATKEEQKPLMHDLASRAMNTAPKNITTPKSAYEFEVSWRHLSSDCLMQANLLKSIPPDSLPQLFKNALSAPMLIEIIKCTTTFFKEEMELAIKILDNLTKVSRFDMILMCLSALDCQDLRKLWDEHFSDKYVPKVHAETLAQLRHRYLPGGW